MSCCCQPLVDSFSDNVFVTITLPDKPMALTILPNLHRVLRLDLEVETLKAYKSADVLVTDTQREQANDLELDLVR